MRVVGRRSALGIDPLEAVQAQVALGPFQIGVRQVDRDARDRTADRRVRGCRAGVAEQVEEALAGRGLLDAQPYRPVIEEHAGVEIVSEIHFQHHVVLDDVDARALAAQPLILRGALLRPPHLEVQAVGRNVQHLAGVGQGGAQPLLGVHRVYGLRRCVFLQVHVALGRGVDVDGDRVLGQVGVVNAVILDAAAFGPLGQVLGVFLQAIGKVAAEAVVGNLRHAGDDRRRCLGLGGLFGFGPGRCGR